VTHRLLAKIECLLGCSVYLAIIIIIIIIKLVITLMHGIYNYVPETNHFSRVLTTLYLQFVLHIMLLRP
jgi:hypothetical protein